MPSGQQSLELAMTEPGLEQGESSSSVYLRTAEMGAAGLGPEEHDGTKTSAGICGCL